MAESHSRQFGFLFPGQGAQFVGMGKDLAKAFPSARQLFEELDDSLSEKLTRMIFEGAESDLRRTENAQPALMSVSLAVVRVLERDFELDLCARGRFAAGHSLGEYSALTAFRALSFRDSARLLRLRGALMQRAVPEGEGAMAAVLGLDIEAVSRVAEDAAKETGGVCVAANDNAPGQVVLSGEADSVARAGELAKSRGARRVLELEVSAPFHCSLMASVEAPMAAALAETEISVPCLPIYSNVTAEPEQQSAPWRELLVRQICASVRWRESLLSMAAGGVTHFVELGAGRALCAMVKRSVPSGVCFSALSPQDLDSLARELTR